MAGEKLTIVCPRCDGTGGRPKVARTRSGVHHLSVTSCDYCEGSGALTVQVLGASRAGPASPGVSSPADR